MKEAAYFAAGVVAIWAYVLILMPARPGSGSAPLTDWQGPAWSAVRAAAYDPATQVLRLRMASGEVYQSCGVPETCFAGLLRSAEKGAYFDRFIRPRYCTERIAPRGV